MSAARPRRHTRRQLARAAAGTALSEGDARRLRELLALEQLAVRVYGLALHSNALSERAGGLVREIRAQERSHVQALAAEVASPFPHAPRDRRDIGAALSRAGVQVDLGAVHGERGWFTLLEQVENALEGAYYEAMAKLAGPRAALLAARILASEAQHQTLLFRLRHPHDITLAVSVGLVHGSAPPPP